MARPANLLVPDLQPLSEGLLERVPEEKKNTIYFQLERLPYSLTGAYYALMGYHKNLVDVVMGALNDSREEVRNALADPKKATGVVISISSENSDFLTHPLDTFFETARRAQNDLIPYLRRATRKDLPDSMNDLVKKFDDRKDSLPEEIREAIIKYWNDHGKRLRAYRAISQHHALVCSDVRVFVRNGRPAYYLTLPNNPEAGSSKLRFSEPTVHATAYVHTAFLELVRMLRTATRILLETNRPSQRVFSIVPREPFELGPGARVEGYYLESPAQFETRIHDFLEALDREAAVAGKSQS